MIRLLSLFTGIGAFETALRNLNIPYEDKEAILKGTGMTVNGNNVSWK